MYIYKVTRMRLNMKSIIENIKNLIPYFILISIYFFFVNLEARNKMNNDQFDNKGLESKKEAKTTITSKDKDNQIIFIPVIPFDK